MIVSFLSPTTPYPIGGVAVIFEFANALTRRGHTVQILHHGIFGKSVSGLDEIEWFGFEPDVVHHFIGLEDPDRSAVPSADIFFGYVPSDRFEERFGLPVVLIQGYGMLGPEIEDHAFRAPCPKVCVASWLVDVGVEHFGMPAQQFVHVPPGLHRNEYAVSVPIEDRRPTVTFLHNTHFKKGTDVAIDALEQVRAQIPDIEVSAFGTFDLAPGFPDWITHHRSPDRRRLIHDIYNQTGIFVSASRLEGFGLPAVEAMACGAALVSTSNGGSGDYAHHEQTALVADVEDAETIAKHVMRLVRNDADRIRIARAGNEYVQRYDWPNAGEQMEQFLERYLGDPDHFTAGGTAGAGFDDDRRTRYL